MKRIYSRAEIEMEQSLTGAEKKNYEQCCGAGAGTFWSGPV